MDSAARQVAPEPRETRRHARPAPLGPPDWHPPVVDVALTVGRVESLRTLLEAFGFGEVSVRAVSGPPLLRRVPLGRGVR